MMNREILRNCLLTLTFIALSVHAQFDYEEFQAPAKEFYPMPFWHINGHLSKQEIFRQMKDAKLKAGFQGVAVLPVNETRPGYLSEAYFEQYKNILDAARELDIKVIMYDDTGFPSGSAGGKVERQHPEFLRRELIKHEYTFRKNRRWRYPIPKGHLMAAVAMDVDSKERINLRPFINNGVLAWDMPRDQNWKVMFFTTEIAPYWKDAHLVDYLNPDAVEKFVEYTYQEYANRFSSYFQDRIDYTFFDDVGFLWIEKTWTNNFNEKFKSLYGTDPDTLYPALWYDIGSETQAARVALFNTRAEMLAEGFPKQVHQWSQKHGLKSTGHPPGNYDIQPVDMHGDIFKFFRYTDMPLMDYIIRYGRGRDGFKLISSAATFYDRPVVATEVYGAIREHLFDTDMLYRMMMELFVRGVNFVVPHGMWYDAKNVRIPPLVSPESEKIVSDLPDYSRYVARSSYLLREGTSIADIGILYPIESLQGNYHFDDPANTVPGSWAYSEADYQEIGRILSTDLHRDFTFIHPEFFSSKKYKISGIAIRLKNKQTPQSYRVLILPGSSIISIETLEKVRQFYRNGGKVIATTLLPTRSAEFGRDKEVQKIIQELFGQNLPSKPQIQTSSKGGKAIFIRNPSEEMLSKALDLLDPNPDVVFSPAPKIKSEMGVFSYMHKIRGKQDIYLFANSGDHSIRTDVLLKGNKILRAWNPHNGKRSELLKTETIKRKGQVYTKLTLELPRVQSIFWISE